MLKTLKPDPIWIKVNKVGDGVERVLIPFLLAFFFYMSKFIPRQSLLFKKSKSSKSSILTFRQVLKNIFAAIFEPCYKMTPICTSCLSSSLVFLCSCHQDSLIRAHLEFRVASGRERPMYLPSKLLPN